MKTVNIIGYYNHNNIGDEQYKISMKKIFNNVDVKFVDCDKLSLYTFDEECVIVLGGGDILNEYFIDKISKKFFGKKNKIIALSVGLPFPSFLTLSNKLEFIDHFFIRTKVDIPLFTSYFNKNRISYIPDVSYLITKGIPLNEQSILNNPINVGLCLVNNGNVSIFVEFIKYILIKHPCIVNLIPFNTGKNASENDQVLYNEIIKYLPSRSVKLIEYKDVYELLNVIDKMDVMICSRFHSCLFSIYRDKPFITIYNTRKIENLLKEYNISEYGYKVNDSYSDITLDKLKVYYNLLLTRRNIIKKKFISIRNNIDKDMHDSLLHINEVCLAPKESNSSSQYQSIRNLYQECNKISKLDDFRKVTDKQLQRTIALYISYKLIGISDSEYIHGLIDKLFTNCEYDYMKEWLWIINDHRGKGNTVTEKSYPYGNFKILDKCSRSIKYHRSGWHLVYNTLYPYSNDKSNLILDLYIDKTFHWNLEFNKLIGVVPYKKPWIGFLHHTFDTTFSEHNNEKLFETKEFIESLKYCKGIIVLSKYLRQQLEVKLRLTRLRVKVFNLIHPSEIENVIPFNFKKFSSKDQISLLHIGGWLRNIYTFYSLNRLQMEVNKVFCKKKYTPIEKVSLKGKFNNNYYPIQSKLAEVLVSEYTHNGKLISNNNSSNNWHKFLYDDIINKIKSVKLIEFVDDQDYDRILSENIVFIHLIDASAVNTVIECIIRNTPIIINKHPAITELLGDKYPLYYQVADSSFNYTDINNQVKKLLKLSNIKKAYKYLKQIDKEQFNINNFFKNFSDIIDKRI